jgi:hypothetical protein
MEKYDPRQGVDPGEISAVQAATELTKAYFAHQPDLNDGQLGDVFDTIYGSVTRAMIKARSKQ